MIDNHVHIGWFTDGYHKPLDVFNSEKAAGISEISVSSTSTCAELYKLVVKEMKSLITVGGSNIHPILWLTPRMLKTYGIRYMLHSKIRWEGIKRHCVSHREWFYNKKLTYQAINIARNLNVPVLLHTGEFKECRAAVFEPLIKSNTDINFVLAHGRPIMQTIDMLDKYSNCFVDTAFMPKEHIKLLLASGLEDKILFGTDAPIDLIYVKDLSVSKYIKEKLIELRSICSEEQFEKITSAHIYY